MNLSENFVLLKKNRTFLQMNRVIQFISNILGVRSGKKRTIGLVAFFVVVSSLVLTPIFVEDIQYEINKPWNGNDLIADFDFAIKKPEDSLKAEQEIIKQRAIPVFILNHNTETNVKNEITSFFNKDGSLPENNKRKKLLSLSLTTIDSLYSAGIINPQPGFSNDLILIRTSPFQEKKTKKNDCYTLNNWTSVWKKKNFSPTLLSDTSLIYNVLSKFITPNLIFSDSLTQAEITNQINQLPGYYGKIAAKTYIVRNGEIITPEKSLILNSYIEGRKVSSRGNQSLLKLFGRMIVVLLLIGILLVYLRFNRIRIFYDIRKLSLILFTIGIVLILMGLSRYAGLLFDKSEGVQFLFLVPTAIVPIIISSFFDSRTSSMSNFVVALMVSILVQQSAEFAFIQSVSGTIAIYSLKLLQKREVFFYTLFYTLIAYISTYLLYQLCFYPSLGHHIWIHLLLLLLNVSFTVFAYPLIYLMEKIFKVSSALSYFELLDTGHPLLQKLTLAAPGTFQHSLQVANIAKAGAIDIEANALLTYVGALFHDIGKMKSPKYFIENYRENENPHEMLKPEESAAIILEHVSHGIDLARKHKLPKEIIDFIETHHGTTKIEVFYHQYLEDNKLTSDKQTELAFSYKGPKPFSKETALVMLADSVEAASRTLKDYSISSLDGLINVIIDAKIQKGQLNNSNLTFRDISIIRKTFLNQLVSIYHNRLAYPPEKQ